MPAQPAEAGIYRVSLAWSNVYVLTDGVTAALVDTGLQKDRPRLLEALQKLGLEASQVRQVLLTHGHTDHAGNAAFFAKLGAEIIAHPREAPFIAPPFRPYAPAGLQRLRHPFTSLSFLVGERLFPVERHPVARLVQQNETVETPVGDLKVIETPGHSPGHISFLRESDGTLFSGDAILNIIPIRLKPELSLPMRIFSSDWEQAKTSARTLAETRPRQMFSGHGNPLTENAAERLLAWANRLR